MSRRTTHLLKGALSTMYYTGLHRAMAPITQGVGLIFMLHHVKPDAAEEFEPNRILKITPEFLSNVIEQVQEAGIDVVSLDELHWRLSEGDFDRPFCAFTFDDGYRDNAEHALPVFNKYKLPFAIYVPTDFADGNGDLWWLALEKVLRDTDQISVNMGGTNRKFKCSTAAEKDAAFYSIYWWLRGEKEIDARAWVRELCRGIGFDPSVLSEELVMNWDEIRALAKDPLVTIGAHTKGHYALAKLSSSEARMEVEDSIDRLERELGARPQHFSYPYGCERTAGPRDFALLKELGMKTAVTTRKGVLFAEHVDHMTALPRVSLNGDYQDNRYTAVFMSGAPFALMNRFRHVNAD